MFMHDLAIYKSWELKQPTVPPRSQLYCLKPVGVGTPYVESLTGYLARLAEAHSVLPGVLMERELAPLAYKRHGSTNLREIYNRTRALNGTGTMALNLVQVLEILTLQSDLCFLTMLVWAKVLPQRALLRSNRVWCPACYEEWRSTGQIIYEPLLWSLDVLKVCPRHQRRLCLQCSHCNQQLPLLARHTRPGYCSNCQQWLGISPDVEPSYSETLAEDKLRWETWIVDSVGELFAAAPLLPSSPPRERIAAVLSTYVDQVAEGNIAAFARMLQIPKNTLWLWQAGQVLPQLNVLLQICHHLGISLLDLLTGKAVEHLDRATVLTQNQYKHAPKVPNRVVDVSQVRRALEEVLEEDVYPSPSMQEVARRLKYDRRFLYRHFPSLCHAISARYVSYRRASRLKRIEQSCLEVRQAAVKLHTRGVDPTRSHVSACLTKPAYFREEEVCTALYEIRRELGLKA